MKTKIHPKLFECEVKCRCGNTFTTRSTLKSLSLAICSECHPFYTGKTKFVDAAGQVDKFVKKFNWDKDKVQDSSKTKNAGLTKRQIRAQIRKEKEAEALRKQRLDQAEAAARAAREEEDERKRSEGEARRAANKARENSPPGASS